jgi:hypothetical protein
VLCGNATYSEAIFCGMPELVEAVKIEVPVSLQRSRRIDIESALIKEISACDAVNIQMELGLYGPTPKKSLRLLKKMIKNAKKLSLTIHRLEDKPINFLRALYNAYKCKSIGSLVRQVVGAHVYSVYKKLIVYAVNNGVTFIVHTHREKKRILALKPEANVLVHPLVWPENAVSNSMDLRRLFDDSTLPIVGLFGFISEYKNFEQVVRVAIASRYFNVLLAGGTHPMSEKYGTLAVFPGLEKASKSSSSHASLSNLIMQTKKNSEGKDVAIQNSVFTYTSPSDQLLVEFMKNVDIVIVPYLEVGQSGSGIASMAIQYGKKVIFSDTKCTSELVRFLNASPVLFDTQSDASLVSAVKLSTKTELTPIHFKGYTFETNIETYLKSVKINTNRE